MHEVFDCHPVAVSRRTFNLFHDNQALGSESVHGKVTGILPWLSPESRENYLYPLLLTSKALQTGFTETFQRLLMSEVCSDCVV